ncbi:predicted protein, partial [Nematostella vectensis]
MTILAYKININGKLRTVSNHFIISMAFADLVLTIGSMPERITRVLNDEQWIIPDTAGAVLCKLANFCEKLSMNVTVLHLAAIAIDRFIAVFHPNRKLITKSMSLKIIGTIWIVSALYCIPILYYGAIFSKGDKQFCKVRRFFTHWKIWYIFFLILLFGIFILIIFLYSAITVKLSRRKTPGVMLSFRKRRIERLSVRVAKMVAVIVSVFYICFLPYWVGWIFCSYHYNNIICSDNFVFVSIFLCYANSSLNPVIFTFFNVNFRVGF